MHWKDLEVWKMSHELVLGIYQITNAFPHTEMFGITNQLRRASSSVPANVVEGQSRKTTKEYLQFLYNARGSLEETRYLLILAKDLNYIDKKAYESCEMNCESISKMLNGLIKSLKKK
jgi:four helix bundle protein